MSEYRTGGSHPLRRPAAAVLMIAASALMLYAVVAPQLERGVPGWEPVNGRVAAALDGLASPMAASAASPDAAAAAETADPPAGTTAGTAGPATSGAQDKGEAEAPSAGMREDGKLDLNAATAEQLDALPGIGPAKARAIVEHRRQHGAFRSVDELLNVKGIGPAILDKVRALATVAE